MTRSSSRPARLAALPTRLVALPAPPSWGALVAALVVALVATPLAGCQGARTGGGAPGAAEAVSVDACRPGADRSSTTTTASASVPAGVGATAQGAGNGAMAMPRLRLSCLGGTGQVVLADLRGPALVNLWASWCEPCRTELPALRHYATRAAGRVAVIGVVTRDRSRDAAQSVISDLGLTFPMVADPDGALELPLGRTTPVGGEPGDLALANGGQLLSGGQRG